MLPPALLTSLTRPANVRLDKAPQLSLSSTHPTLLTDCAAYEHSENTQTLSIQPPNRPSCLSNTDDGNTPVHIRNFPLTCAAMVAPPATGGSGPVPAAPTPQPTSRMGATPATLPPLQFPYSARRAQPLDLKTVERRGHTSSRSPPQRTRPHGLLEAPTFRPTEAEFKDPMTYLRSIYDKASRFGICKIVPPEGWNPDFAIDTEVRREHGRDAITSYVHVTFARPLLTI